jgi:hypothetical protein
MKVSAFSGYSWPTHINGMYVCVLGIWWLLFQKRIVCTKLYIYVFIVNLKQMNHHYWSLRRFTTSLCDFLNFLVATKLIYNWGEIFILRTLKIRYMSVFCLFTLCRHGNFTGYWYFPILWHFEFCYSNK